MAHMKRREFISMLGGALAARRRLAARRARNSQQGCRGSDGLPSARPRDRSSLKPLSRDCGSWAMSRVDPSSSSTRWPADIRDRVPELVRELLALKVQVIVAQGAIVPVVRRAIDSTPVVFGYSGDPVEAGLVNSFSRPGGNFTGATFMSYEVNAKRVELLREAFPHVTRVAILSNPLHPGEQRELKESEQGAERLGIGAFLCSNAVGRRNRAGIRAHPCRRCRSHDRPAGWAGHAASEADH